MSIDYTGIYGANAWVKASDFNVDYSVIIIGAGPSGVILYHKLMSIGVTDVLVIDRNSDHDIGSWGIHCYNERLRSPKDINGWEESSCDLSIEYFIRERYGDQYWLECVNLTRFDWISYVSWFKDRVGVRGIYHANVNRFYFHDNAISQKINANGSELVIRCRCLVVASGMAGYGGWYVPRELERIIPSEFLVHANDPILGSLGFKEKAVLIVGAGASAFDAAHVGIMGGAKSIDVVYRRDSIPTKEYYREMEKYIFLENYYSLSDVNKIKIFRAINKNGTPPASHNFNRVLASDKARVYSRPDLYQQISVKGGKIRLGIQEYDIVISATGFCVECEREELFSPFCDDIVKWGDIYQGLDDRALEGWEKYPYLGSHYQMRFKNKSWAGIFLFNGGSTMSMGQIGSVSISSYKFGLNRLARGISMFFTSLLEDRISDDIVEYFS